MKFRVILTIVALLIPSGLPAAEKLEEWIIRKIEADEQLIRDSIARANGQDLELLRASRWYVPFFLDAPKGAEATTPKDRSALEELLRPRQDFLPGGYILRLSFPKSPPLYALSAGLWEGGARWHCLELGKDFELEAANVWEGRDGEDLYVTMLSKGDPRLLAYGKDGAVTKDQTFDPNAADFETQWSNTEALYANRRTTREMIPLAEYLQAKNPTWRPLVLRSRFNLRNQQQHDDEKPLVARIPPMNREGMTAALKKRLEAAPTQ